MKLRLCLSAALVTLAAVVGANCSSYAGERTGADGGGTGSVDGSSPLGPDSSNDGPVDATVDAQPSPDEIRSAGGGDGWTDQGQAFDGQTDQSAALSASMSPIFRSMGDRPSLYREYNCRATLGRVDVYAPNNSSFVMGADAGADTSGTVTLFGRTASANWISLGSAPFAGNATVVTFDSAALRAAADYVAYGIAFTFNDDLNHSHDARLLVAELAMQAQCTAPASSFSWQTTEWTCNAECVAASNEGVHRRGVSCRRDGLDSSLDGLCTEPKPVNEDGSCTYSCDYTLTYLGPRQGNDYLHHGSATQAPGPLPSDVANGDTRAEIEGHPCSIKSTSPSNYFTGFFCDDGEISERCAFLCQ